MCAIMCIDFTPCTTLNGLRDSVALPLCYKDQLLCQINCKVRNLDKYQIIGFGPKTQLP